MTIEEKITRYRGIPKLIKDLQIDKEICTSVKSVQFDSIGAAHGSAENRTEQKLLRAAEIDEEIGQLVADVTVRVLCETGDFAGDQPCHFRRRCKGSGNADHTEIASADGKQSEANLPFGGASGLWCDEKDFS